MRDENGKEVSGNDHSGPIHDSRPGRHEEPAQDARGILRSDAESVPTGIDSGGPCEGEGQLIGEAIAEGAARGLQVELESFLAVSSSGPIPDPTTLERYSPEIQKKIIDWQDRKVKATFDDASAREDKLANAEIKKGSIAQWTSFAVNITIVVGALGVFIATGDPSVFWSYTILGANVIGNVVININDNRKGTRKNNDQRE